MTEIYCGQLVGCEVLRATMNGGTNEEHCGSLHHPNLLPWAE